MNSPESINLPIIVAISGASGAIFGIRALQLLSGLEIPTHLVISPTARYTIEHETDFSVAQVEALATNCCYYNDLSAPIASGSTKTRGMMIIPCSIKTLSGVANSYSDNLMVRAADVCLKEGRPLLLAVRETPLHIGHLRLMEMAANSGAIIFPPIPAFYGRPQNKDDLITNTVGRMLQRIGIQNGHFREWQGL